MAVEITARLADGDRDLAISAPAGASWGEVRPAVADALGVAADLPLWLGDRPLDAQVRCAEVLRVGAVVSCAPGRSLSRASVLALEVVAGPASGLVVSLERGTHGIGRAPDCAVVLPDPDVSRRHAELEVTRAGAVLRDLGSTNGTRLDGRPVPTDGVRVRPGQLIGIGTSVLTLATPTTAPASVQPGPDGTVLLLRPPRHSPRSTDDEIVLPRQPSGGAPRGAQWLAALLPAAAGGLLAWLSGSLQFLLFALLSPLMMLATAVGDRVHWRRTRRKATAEFRARWVAAERRIADGLRAEAAARRSALCDPATLLRHASLPSGRVWERRAGDGDALTVRIGVANLPAQLRVRDEAGTRPAGTLDAVPVPVDLRTGPLGVGGPPEIREAVARWVVAQLAASHAPDDLHIVGLLGEHAAECWEWLRWLPHARGRIALSPAEHAVLVADLAASVERRSAARRLGRDKAAEPFVVLVVDHAGLVGEVPGLAQLLEHAPGIMTAICVDGTAAALPRCCRTTVVAEGLTGTQLRVRTTDREDVLAVADQVTAAWADALSRALAPLAVVGGVGEAAPPDSCGLLEVLELPTGSAEAIAARWAASDGSATAVLGCGADGAFAVDLVRDEPHALVAGTTGSGKSELLQTLVAALAVRHPPDELTFLLIDYKGGAAFAQCGQLPHTASVVTDLDPYLTERALRSLDAELHRRERLFVAAGAADLDAYRATGGASLRRLIIVVDEFATLSDELPDFVTGLVGVAQRGRSLGVHLVLATQRPGGAVSPEIRANTSLRIALRMTDAAESLDVIDAPDAALLARATPGRGYVRTGQSLRCVQIAHAGGVSPHTETAITVELLDRWHRRGSDTPDARSTDLASVVAAAREAAAVGAYRAAQPPWLPPLPEHLSAQDVCPPGHRATVVSLGRVDLPDELQQPPLVVDLADGTSLLAAGAPRSGRTGLLTALGRGAAAQLSPGDLHVHVIDRAGALATALDGLPHLGTVLDGDAAELAPRLLQRLVDECQLRTNEPGHLARVLLLVDNWDAVTARLADVDALVYTELLTNLLRMGASAGLTVAVTGDRSLFAPRFAAAFAERLLLRLGDRADYAVGGVNPRDVPAIMPPGRAIRATDGAVVQVVTPDSLPVTAVRSRGAVARRIQVRALPSRIRLDELPATPGRLVLGVAGDAATPLAVDPSAGAGRLLVAGPPRSGRSTTLCSLAGQGVAAGYGVVAAAPARSPLHRVADELGVAHCGPADGLPALPVGVPTLLLVDDSEAFADTALGEQLLALLRAPRSPLCAVVAGRADEVATSYRGLAAEVRRNRCGILLRPGPVDGDLLGVRLPRRSSAGPPGRGVIVGEPVWGPLFTTGEPVPIQMAEPIELSPCGGSGGRWVG